MLLITFLQYFSHFSHKIALKKWFLDSNRTYSSHRKTPVPSLLIPWISQTLLCVTYFRFFSKMFHVKHIYFAFFTSFILHFACFSSKIYRFKKFRAMFHVKHCYFDPDSYFSPTIVLFHVKQCVDIKLYRVLICFFVAIYSLYLFQIS